MAENNVVTFKNGVNMTVSEVLRWVDAMGERGIFGGASARLRKTAIEQLTSVLADDEPDDVEWVLSQIENLANRWGNKKNANPQTTRTYRSRAQNTMRDYLEFQKNPEGFKPRAKAAKRAGAKKKKRNPKTRSDGAAQSVAQRDIAGTASKGSAADSSESPTDSSQYRTYPLGSGRVIKYTLPPDGITTRDVFRMSLHLLTMAEDFDPLNPEHAQMFSIVRSSDKD